MRPLATKLGKMSGGALRKISGNAGALFAIQLANALLPLLLAPFLARTLGKDGYGLFALGIAFIQVATIFTDYGFGLSAVYQIARTRGNTSRIQRIAGAVYACKIILCVLATAGVFAYPLLREEYAAHRDYFWVLSLSVIGITLQPVWLFQGLERMGSITLYVLASRLSFVALTLLLARDAGDLELVAWFNGLSHLLAAGIGLAFVRRAGVWPRWTSWRYAWKIFHSSTEYFWSRLAVASYGAGAILFLGTFSTPAQVALYSVAEQFYRGAIAVYSPVTQALYPHMARHRDVTLFKRLFAVAVALAVVGIALGVILGPWLIGFVFGPEYAQSYGVFFVFMLALGAAIPSILLGYPFLGAMGNASAANRSVVFAGLVQVLALAVLYVGHWFSALAVVGAVLAAEVSALLWRIHFARPYFKTSISVAGTK